MTSTTTTTQRYQRKDGRDMMQIRPISLTMGDIAGRSNTATTSNDSSSTSTTAMSTTSTTSTTSGCAKYRCGSSCVLALVFGPSTAKATSERYDQAVIQVSIQRTTTNSNSNSAAGAEATKLLAVHEKRRQQIEENRIVSMIRRVLMDTVIDVTQFPRCVIGVNLQILQQDGSLEACCFNAAMAAILDSGIRCKTTIAAVSVGALVEGDSKNIVKNDDAAPTTSTSTSTTSTILDLTDFEESEFVKSRSSSSSERTEDEQQKQQQQFQLPPFKAKGTFVVSYPASSGGIVATSDILFAQTQQQIESLTQMERAANAAGGRLFEIFREAVAQKTHNGGSDENADSAM